MQVADLLRPRVGHHALSTEHVLMRICSDYGRRLGRRRFLLV